MVPCFLLTLLLVSTVSAEVNCTEHRPQNIPSIASCDIALQHLARYLFPCLGRETVKVGQRSTFDIRLPAIFADKTAYPQPTPQCMIEFFWDGPVNDYESIQPGMLQAFATGMKNQCIAASPPQFAQGRIEPSRRIYVKFEGAYGVGNMTSIGANGTEIPVDLPLVNPTDACRGRAEPLYGVRLDGPQPIVDTS